jgi:hypothetical protein
VVDAYFIRSWLLDRKLFSLEEGVRRITLPPTMVTGLEGPRPRSRSYHADVCCSIRRASLGKKKLVERACRAARIAGRCGPKASRACW